MAQMVYIREIHPRSFLHFSTSGESFCLRDFSQPGDGPAVELERQSPDRTASTIRLLASKRGNRLIEVPGQGNGVRNYSFWHKKTLELNAHYIEEPVASLAPAVQEKSWLFENAQKIIVGVITAVVVAVVLTWLGGKQQ